jgi:hypothetical protein
MRGDSSRIASTRFKVGPWEDRNDLAVLSNSSIDGDDLAGDDDDDDDDDDDPSSRWRSRPFRSRMIVAVMRWSVLISCVGSA